MMCFFGWHSWEYQVREIVEEKNASTGEITRYVVRGCQCGIVTQKFNDTYKRWEKEYILSIVGGVNQNLSNWLGNELGWDVKTREKCIEFGGMDFLVRSPSDGNVVCRVTRDTIKTNYCVFPRYRVYTFNIPISGPVTETEVLATFSMTKIPVCVKHLLQERTNFINSKVKEAVSKLVK